MRARGSSLQAGNAPVSQSRGHPPHVRSSLLTPPRAERSGCAGLISGLPSQSPSPFAMQRLSLALLAAAPSVLLAQSAPVQRPTAFVNVTVVPMDRERTIPNATVIVREGRITSVGPAAQAQIPGDALRIDAAGKYLMPGIAEMHAHVPPGSPTEQTLKDLMFQYIANGVTTIRGMLGSPYQIPLRDRLARGEMLGPTFYVAAPSLNGNSAPTPDSAVKLVRAHKAAGYDLLKIHPGLSRAAYDAMVRTAGEVGITWAGHVPADVGIAHAMETRQSTVDHLDGFLEGSAAPRANIATTAEMVKAADPSKFAELARRSKAMGVWHVPTMLVWANIWAMDETPEQMAARDEMRYAPPQQVQTWINQKRNRNNANVTQQGMTPEIAVRFMELRKQMLKAVVDADGLLLMGTDSPQMFMVPGFALHRELRIMASAGLTPFQILQSGTVNVARYAREVLRADGNFGTVAPGMRADLVLLDANPLADVANLQKRSGVMVKGVWVSADEIRAGLEAIVRR
jgi:imidazolonepropionase-like amidohydrolase